ncbi:MAG: hypothetical protein ACREME_01305, partial [Gemmatimonadales bacterium]
MTAVALALGVGGGVVAAAPPYERPADRKVEVTLPPELAKGPYHKVRDPIVADGYMLHFTVQSTFGKVPLGGDIILTIQGMPATAANASKIRDAMGKLASGAPFTVRILRAGEVL